MEPAYPQPLVMVDTALFTIRDERLCLILTRRKEPPFEGLLALPGGFVHAQEDADTEAAARRVIRGKIGFDAPYLEQLFTFSGAARDPRGWSVSIVYYALIPCVPAGPEPVRRSMPGRCLAAPSLRSPADRRQGGGTVAWEGDVFVPAGLPAAGRIHDERLAPDLRADHRRPSRQGVLPAQDSGAGHHRSRYRTASAPARTGRPSFTVSPARCSLRSNVKSRGRSDAGSGGCFLIPSSTSCGEPNDERLIRRLRRRARR